MLPPGLVLPELTIKPPVLVAESSGLVTGASTLAVLPPKLVLPPELTVEPPLPPGVCAASCAFDELEQAAKGTAVNRINTRQDWIRTLMVMRSSPYFHGFSRQHLR
jgi:hypothetical protein